MEFARITKVPGADMYTTPQGHTIEAHPARPGVQNAYVSVLDTDGRFLINYAMDSTAEAISEAPNVAYAYAAGHPY